MRPTSALGRRRRRVRFEAPQELLGALARQATTLGRRNVPRCDSLSRRHLEHARDRLLEIARELFVYDPDRLDTRAGERRLPRVAAPHDGLALTMDPAVAVRHARRRRRRRRGADRPDIRPERSPQGDGLAVHVLPLDGYVGGARKPPLQDLERGFARDGMSQLFSNLLELVPVELGAEDAVAARSIRPQRTDVGVQVITRPPAQGERRAKRGVEVLGRSAREAGAA